MSIDIKSGSLSDFFASAKETAKEIDKGKKLTKKNTIWVDSKDLMLLLKPERANLIRYLRKEKKVVFSELMQALNRSAASLNNDLKILSKYDLICISKQINPGHGVHKIIESSFGNEKLEFRVEI
ncbi:MAG: helix-turn-helix transcriptional regulator [Thiotrichaceae bacterium]|nr:helix-turn-helix transcriptional regulator [Thiotrichaceae bacterium]